MRLAIDDFNQVAYNTARFFRAENQGFIIGTGLRKEVADFLVPGACKLTAKQRVEIFSELHANPSQIPGGAVSWRCETIDLFWFVSVYLEKFLGVKLSQVLGDITDFRDYQAKLSDLELSPAEFENAKERLVNLGRQISDAFIDSDKMSRRGRQQLGRNLLPIIRDFLDLVVILAQNSARQFDDAELNLEKLLLAGLWRNKQRKISGNNFHIVSADLRYNGEYTKNSGFGRGTKDIVSSGKITKTARETNNELSFTAFISENNHKNNCATNFSFTSTSVVLRI
jgi:hypothetical protein